MSFRRCRPMSTAAAIAKGHIPVPWYTPSVTKSKTSSESPYISLSDYLNPSYPEQDNSISGILARLAPVEDRIGFEQLYAAHCHHGHPRRFWNPRMSRYIIGHRSDTHIIDLEETVAALNRALKLAQGIIVCDGTILFVSTRRMMVPLAIQNAVTCGQPYLVDKWVPGLISNFNSVFQATQTHIETMNENPSKFVKSKGRLARRAAGVGSLSKPPDAIFFMNLKENQGAIREAQNANIPIIGICDTDCDPQDIAYPIPCNDDNITSVGLIAQTMSDVIREAMEIKGHKIDLSFLNAEQLAASTV